MHGPHSAPCWLLLLGRITMHGPHSAPCWLLLLGRITMHGPLKVKLIFTS